jgi:hypothetical protein
MSDADIASIRDAAGAMPDTVAAWSHGYTSVAATVAISTHTLDKVDPYGSGSVWLSPDDARADLSALAPLGQYDAVFVAWDNQADQGDNLLLPYGGLGGLYDPITGAYFASGLLPGAGWPSWWFPTLLIHEWLHGVTDYYALWGYKGPSPDDGDRDGYTVGSDMHDFYSDLMTGTVHLADGTPLGGITQALWQSGSPTSRPVACSR